MRTLAFVGALAVLAACGGEETATIPEVNVPPSPGAIEAPSLGQDTITYSDSVVVDTLAGADADSTLAPAAAPAFPAFLADLKAQIRAGNRNAVAALATAPAAQTLANGGHRFAFEGAIGERFLSAEPARYRRDGTRRTLSVVVGFDGEGEVVPEDEAETESGAVYTFDLVDGEYRLIRLDLAG